MMLAYKVFFFNDTATTEIYTLSLHDALPISARAQRLKRVRAGGVVTAKTSVFSPVRDGGDYPTSGQLATRRKAFNPLSVSRSEEHTSELQSRQYLVCRLLLEKKKTESH